MYPVVGAPVNVTPDGLNVVTTEEAGPLVVTSCGVWVNPYGNVKVAVPISALQ